MADAKPPKSRPRLADIAAEAGVSIATVSRVLNDHPAILPETKASVRKIAEARGYPVRDPGTATARRPRSPKPRRNGAICLVMALALPPGRPLANPFELNLIGGIGAALRDYGLDFSIAAQAPYDDKTLASYMARHPYDGTIFLGQSQYHDALDALAEGARPFVVWGVDVPGQRYCSIGSDNFEGGRMATSHLIGRSRHNIAFIGHPPAITSAQTRFSQLAERMAGFRAAMAAANLSADMAMIQPAPTGIQAGIEATKALLAKHPRIDGIVASSDLVAIGAIEMLTERGLQVPADVAVVGYDDAEVASQTRPRLTTIRQDALVAGQLLVSKLLRAMAGHQVRSERLPTELVIRDSCGARMASDAADTVSDERTIR